MTVATADLDTFDLTAQPRRDYAELLKAGQPLDPGVAIKDEQGNLILACGFRLQRSVPMEVEVGDAQRISNGHRQAMFDEVFSGPSQTGRPRPFRTTEPRSACVILANEATDSRSRIPRNDPLRKRGFQIVMD